MQFIYDIPDEAVPAIVRGFCGTYPYQPPKDEQGVLRGNDTLGCDSLGQPTQAGQDFAVACILNFARTTCVAWHNKQIQAAANEQLAVLKAQIAAVPITVTTMPSV